MATLELTTHQDEHDLEYGWNQITVRDGARAIPLTGECFSIQELQEAVSQLYDELDRLLHSAKYGNPPTNPKRLKLRDIRNGVVFILTHHSELEPVTLYQRSDASSVGRRSPGQVGVMRISSKISYSNEVLSGDTNVVTVKYDGHLT